MAFVDMTNELTGAVAKLPRNYARTLINRAWSTIRDIRLWSFQLFETGVNTPAVISTGTFSATLGSDQITANAAATTALTGLTFPLLTQRQWRANGLSIYNIIAIVQASPLILKLDRPFIDTTPPTGISYQVLQCYYPAPYKDFKRWLDWRDMVNGSWLDIYQTRQEIDLGDPQRLYYSFPRWVVPYAIDTRPGSSTPGWNLYELYPNPVQTLSYMTYGVRTGVDLVNPSDELPAPIPEELVLAKARQYAYEWAEANRDPMETRGQNANFEFLYAAAKNEFEEKLKEIGRKDRDLVDLFKRRIQRFDPNRRIPYYSTVTGRAYSGGM